MLEAREQASYLYSLYLARLPLLRSRKFNSK